MTTSPIDLILTVDEVAEELRCSRGHVYALIRGDISGVTRLPAISAGRRKLIRRSSLELWKDANDQGRDTLSGQSEARQSA